MTDLEPAAPSGEDSELPGTAPGTYAEARALLDASLDNIPPYRTCTMCWFDEHHHDPVSGCPCCAQHDGRCPGDCCAPVTP